MPLYFDQFHLDDFPADWPMILVGWRGLGRWNLSAEQVTAYALEQIGKGTPEQDEVAALLANTNPSEWQTIDRYLAQVAETETFDRNIALRKWRLAELKSRMNDVLPVDEDADGDEHDSILYYFADFWRDHDELPDSVTMIPDWSAPAKEVVQQQQAWAEQEQILLWGDVETTR